MSNPVTPGSEFDQFRKTYFEECAEILIDFDERLASMQSELLDTEGLNAIFRAVHSIKAGAGAFNFTQLASFAHTFEALLDWLRDGRIQQDERVSQVLVRAGDVLAEFVEAAKENRTVHQNYGKDIECELEALLRDAGHAGGGGSAAQAKQDDASVAGGEDATRTYWISFKPYAELFRHANEPLLLIRELKGLGEPLAVGDGPRGLLSFMAVPPAHESGPGRDRRGLRVRQRGLRSRHRA
jgi:two-component system chemotaxis sensor kinase CheA